jgi:hypothetical protein
MEMARSRFPYSAPVYAYVSKAMKRDLLALRRIDPNRMSESQVVQSALAEYVPRLKAQLGSFPTPAHEAPGLRRRRPHA